MDALDLMDALQVHAAAAAAAIDSGFTDVHVGFPAAKGRSIRIFYGGEREAERMGAKESLNSKLMAEAVIVRAYWPISDTGAVRHREIEGEMVAFVKGFRTRVLGDVQLGGESIDSLIQPAQCEQVTISSTRYAVIDMEFVADYTEYSIAP